MRALHQVVSRSTGVRKGIPVFVGTRVPVKALMDHLDRGGDLDSFLGKYGSVSRELALAACALGLESLIASAQLESGPTQRSLLPRTRSDGVLDNAEELSVGLVTGKRVLCPACRELVFKSWPEGWDGHAARRCRGLARGDGDDRKAEYKRRYGHLFR